MTENNITIKGTLKDVMTELELTKVLGVSKQGLYRLRTERELPFIQISNRSRLYLESDIMVWLERQKKVLNRGVFSKTDGTGE